MTINVAKQMFIENERGSISKGNYADFLLVNKDVLTCPVTEIHTAKPEGHTLRKKRIFVLTDRAEKIPDYSDKACWYKITAITKDVDTF